MAAPDKRLSSVRPLQVMFGVVLVIALFLLTRSWGASLIDRYEFRQLQTALTAHWINAEGWQLDYLTPLFGPPWSIPMEFPTYQVLVVWLHQLTGLPLEQAGRAIGIFFLLACLPALHDLLALAGLAPSRRLIVHAIVLTAPVYLFYGRAFMIETTALCFAIWFLALLRRSFERTHPGWIIAATAAAVLAALTKITTFLLFGLPAVALAIAAWRATVPALPRGRLLIAALVPAVVSLGVAWWWIAHADAVKDSNPFTGFLTARELRGWNFGPLALRFDSSFWVRVQENIVGYNLAEGAIAVALLCVPFAPVRTRWMAGIALLAFFSGPLVFANLYHLHDYYYAANSLFLLAAGGGLLAAVWDDPRLPRGANWLALVLILSFQLHAFYRGYYSHHRLGARPPPELATIIRHAVPADGVVLIYGHDWDPLLPYYFQRRALMVPAERDGERDVLEQVIARLPPRRIAAMVIHGDRLRSQLDFARERAARFGLALAPAARDADNDLYLPASASTASTVPPIPTEDDFSAALKPVDSTDLDLSIFSPAPAIVRGKYGASSADLAGRRVLNAHAPSELVFRPSPTVRHVRAVAGLPDNAFTLGSADITDGITVEIVAVAPGGFRRTLLSRSIDPARRLADRGPQVLEADLPQPFVGELLLRLGNGANNDPTNDWAYWASVEIR